MSASIWSEPEPALDETYPPALLRAFLKHMIKQFGAHGACIALYDEHINQMRMQAHMRLTNVRAMKYAERNGAQALDANGRQNRRTTINLLQEAQALADVPTELTAVIAAEEIEDVTPEQCELFSVGSTYLYGRGVIGYVWKKNEAAAFRNEDYEEIFNNNQPLSVRCDVLPSMYLVVPICENILVEELHGNTRQPAVLGVMVLYQVLVGSTGFQRQRQNILQYADTIALHLQNDRLRRAQLRTADYLKQLQNISIAFPTSVKLSDLMENIYQFTSRIVDVSSMLLRIYDRDLERLYDVLALRNGKRIEGLGEHPLVHLKDEHPVWWEVTQHDRKLLHFSPAQDVQKAQRYQELLTGVWGDQRQTGSFLLLPMKMFNRVVGSLCLTSKQVHAYHQEEIQVLETMVQIVTVSIENAKLYERDRDILQMARQREAQLAATNSALQSISSTLNVTELLNNLVESVASVLKVDLCAFFQLSPAKDMLIAHALYAPSNVQMIDDGSGMPVVTPPKRDKPDQIINLIQLPFKDTMLAQMVNEGFFYLDPPLLEEIAQQSPESGLIFLREINIQYMLVIPMTYQQDFIGFLMVPTPNGNRTFRPKDVGTLLAICAQAASAIRNAQLFEERQVAYAEMKRMSELKDEFLVTASHELRTPLTAIRGYSSHLLRQSSRANPQQVHRFATKISVAAQQLSDLVANMTEAANIGVVGKNLDLHVEAVQLRAAAEIAVNMLTLKSEQNVRLQIPPDLWINGDGPRVRQVLTNLLENAAKYSLPESSVLVTAQKMVLKEVEPLLSEDQVNHAVLLEKAEMPIILVRVEDHGEGILPDDRQRIFDKFVRAPRSLTTPVRGSGLGLYICRRFIEAMDGRLWLERSVPNEGSTFTFYLPYVEPPVETVE